MNDDDDNYQGLSVTPRPEKGVDTWQPLHTLEWVPVSRKSFKGSQGIWHPNPFEKWFTTPPIS